MDSFKTWPFLVSKIVRFRGWKNILWVVDGSSDEPSTVGWIVVFDPGMPDPRMFCSESRGGNVQNSKRLKPPGNVWIYIYIIRIYIYYLYDHHSEHLGYSSWSTLFDSSFEAKFVMPSPQETWIVLCCALFMDICPKRNSGCWVFLLAFWWLTVAGYGLLLLAGCCEVWLLPVIYWLLVAGGYCRDFPGCSFCLHPEGPKGVALSPEIGVETAGGLG